MPHLDKNAPNKDEGEVFVVVSLKRITLNKSSNYFATLKAEFPPQNQPNVPLEEANIVTFRTEVQKNCKQPIFKTKDFSFSLPPTTSHAAFSELLLYSPCIYIQMFEVLRKDERGVAKPYGSATWALSKDQIDSLVSRRVLKFQLFLQNNGATVGQCDVEACMSETTDPQPMDASPRGLSPTPLPASPLMEPPRRDITSPNPEFLDDPERLTFTITVHCGVNLGSKNLPAPSPFVTAKTTRDAAAKRPAKTATMMSKSQRNVLWNEKLIVAMSRKDMAEGQGIFLAVIDFDTKRYIGKCIIPVKGISLGHQYHLRLLTHEDNGYLLVSLSMEDRMDSEINQFLKDSELYHVQLYLKHLRDVVQQQHQYMIAVINLVEDGQAYRQNYIADNVPKIPFTTLRMNEAHDRFSSVSRQWHKVTPVWHIGSQPSLNHLFEFTIDRKQRQTNFCITIELFYLDFSVISVPNSPLPTSVSTPHFGGAPTARDSAGLVFWGSAVLSLFELIQAPARTVAINEIQIPIYRSHNLINHIELDLKRRDAHDYMKDIAPTKQHDRAQIKQLRKPSGPDLLNMPSSPQPFPHSSRTPSPSPKPHTPSTPSPKPTPMAAPSPLAHGTNTQSPFVPPPPRLDSITEDASNFFYSNTNHRDNNYNYMLQNGLFPVVPTKPNSTSPSTPHAISNTPMSGDIPAEVAFPSKRSKGAARPHLTIIPPSTPGTAHDHATQQSKLRKHLTANEINTPSTPNPAPAHLHGHHHHHHPHSNSPTTDTESGPNLSDSYDGDGMNSFGSTSSTGSASSTGTGTGSVGGLSSGHGSGSGAGFGHRHLPRVDSGGHANGYVNGKVGNGSNEEVRGALEQMQRIVDQLLKDRESTHRILKRVERDISELRGENQALMHENAKLKDLDVEKKESLIKEKLEQLTRAQDQMAIIIEQMKVENSEIPKYMETAKKQEQIIQKYEALLKFSITEMKKAKRFEVDLQAAADMNQKLHVELLALKKKQGINGANGLNVPKPRLAATIDNEPHALGKMDYELSDLSFELASPLTHKSPLQKNNSDTLLALPLVPAASRNPPASSSVPNSTSSSLNLSSSLPGHSPLGMRKLPLSTSSSPTSPKSSSSSIPSIYSPTSHGSSGSVVSLSPTPSFSHPPSLTSSHTSLASSSHSLTSSQAHPPQDHHPLQGSQGSNFDKNWELYNSRSPNSASSRIKARKNMPVKHKETGEYRRPHLLLPMGSPPPSAQ